MKHALAVLGPLGLLALILVLMAGCYRTECEITCTDGFKITTADECDDSPIGDLAKDHGGICTGEEHDHLCAFPGC